MRAIGEDIVLLAIKRNGTFVAYERLRFALAASQLVQLAAAGRIKIDHRIVVLDPTPTGDALTDLTLAALHDKIRPPYVREWIDGQRIALVDKYLERLAAVGTIRREDRKVLGCSATPAGGSWSMRRGRPTRKADSRRSPLQPGQ